MVEKTLVCCRKIDHFGVEVAFIPENWKTRIEMVLLNETGTWMGRPVNDRAGLEITASTRRGHPTCCRSKRGKIGDMGEPLTDEQIAEEEKFLAGLPRVNLGALFLAPVWGPAHGMWAAFLFFVAWLFADNVIYAATVEPTAMNVVLAILMAAGLVGATAVFAIVAQPFAAHRAENMGVSRRDLPAAAAHLGRCWRDHRRGHRGVCHLVQLGSAPDAGYLGLRRRHGSERAHGGRCSSSGTGSC